MPLDTDSPSLIRADDTLVFDPNNANTYTIFRPSPQEGEMTIIAVSGNSLVTTTISLVDFAQVCTAFSRCAITARDKHDHILA